MMVFITENVTSAVISRTVHFLLDHNREYIDLGGFELYPYSRVAFELREHL